MAGGNSSGLYSNLLESGGGGPTPPIEETNDPSQPKEPIIPTVPDEPQYDENGQLIFQNLAPVAPIPTLPLAFNFGVPPSTNQETQQGAPSNLNSTLGDQGERYEEEMESQMFDSRMDDDGHLGQDDELWDTTHLCNLPDFGDIPDNDVILAFSTYLLEQMKEIRTKDKLANIPMSDGGAEILGYKWSEFMKLRALSIAHNGPYRLLGCENPESFAQSLYDMFRYFPLSALELKNDLIFKKFEEWSSLYAIDQKIKYCKEVLEGRSDLEQTVDILITKVNELTAKIEQLKVSSGMVESVNQMAGALSSVSHNVDRILGYYTVTSLNTSVASTPNAFGPPPMNQPPLTLNAPSGASIQSSQGQPASNQQTHPGSGASQSKVQFIGNRPLLPKSAHPMQKFAPIRPSSSQIMRQQKHHTQGPHVRPSFVPSAPQSSFATSAAVGSRMSTPLKPASDPNNIFSSSSYYPPQPGYPSQGAGQNRSLE